MPIERSGTTVKIKSPIHESACGYGFSETIFMSYQNVIFFKGYPLGTVARNNFEDFDMCYNAAKRKCGRSEPLVEKDGLLSDFGRRAYSDADSYYNALRAKLNAQPKFDKSYRMDEIILFGDVPKYGIRILRLLWQTLPEESRTIKAYAPGESWTAPLAESYEGQPLIPLEHVRSNSYARAAVETMIGYNLFMTANIGGSHEWERGRGRSKVGFGITEMGRRFYEDYLKNFDNVVQMQIKYSGKLSVSPSIFDNLDELLDEEASIIQSRYGNANRVPKTRFQTRQEEYDEQNALIIERAGQMGPPETENEETDNSYESNNFYNPGESNNSNDSYEKVTPASGSWISNEDIAKMMKGRQRSDNTVMPDMSVQTDFDTSESNTTFETQKSSSNSKKTPVDPSDIDPVTGENLRELFGG